MFRHTFAIFGLGAAVGGLCLDGPDDGGGGGSATPPAVDPAATAPDLVDPAADPGAGGDPGQGGDDADDDDDDDADDAALIASLPEAQIRNRHRRLQRKVSKKIGPIADRFRDDTGRYLSPAEVDRIRRDARDFGEIDTVLSRSPRAMQVLLEERDRLAGGGTAPAAAAAAAPVPFEESEDGRDWPYDRDTPEGKRLWNAAKRAYDSDQRLTALTAQLNQDRQSRDRDSVTQLSGRWKEATFKAAEEVAPEYRPLFIKSVRAQFDLHQVRGTLRNLDPQRVIDEALADVRAQKKKTTTATTRRSSEIVARNITLPQTPRPGTTTPAAGTKPPAGQRETLKDSKRSFFQRVGRT